MNSEGSVAPRTGFFHNFEKREILVKTWCTKEEDFVTNGNRTQYTIAKLNSSYI